MRTFIGNFSQKNQTTLKNWNFCWQGRFTREKYRSKKSYKLIFPPYATSKQFQFFLLFFFWILIFELLKRHKNKKIFPKFYQHFKRKSYSGIKCLIYCLVINFCLRVWGNPLFLLENMLNEVNRIFPREMIQYLA